MLKNLVKETTNNPGTGGTINLAGAPTGYVTFLSQFPSGSPVLYFITDGTKTECNTGVVTSGSPVTLSRGTTPIWTSTGATSRLNFTGTVSVFCAQPAERTLWGDAAGVWQAQNRRMTSLANATGNTDAVSFGQIGWYVADEKVGGTPAGGAVSFAIPAGTPRVRFEFSDCAPASQADMYMRVSRDGGSTYMSGAADYTYQYQGTGGLTKGYLPLVGAPVGETVLGFVEFQTNARGMGYFHTTSMAATPGTTLWLTDGGFAQTSGSNITHVLFGFVNTTTGAAVNIAAHRIRMLAQRV